jgi:diguanylate cyclase (GGDEF)-like protein
MNRLAAAPTDRELVDDAFAADVFDLLPLPAIIVNEHGAVLAANPAWDRLLAATGPLDVVHFGMPDLDGKGQGAAQLWDLLNRAPEPAQPQLSYCISLGERWFEIHVSRTGWRTRTWIATCEDVTDHRQAELTAARVRATLRAGPDALVIVDFETMQVVEVNDIACHVLGRSRAELLAQPPADLFSSTLTQLRSSYADLIRSGLVDSCSAVTCRPDGSAVSLELRRRAMLLRGRWLVISTARTAAPEQPLQRGRQELQHQLLARFGQFVLSGPGYDELAAETREVLRRGLGVELCRLLELEADGGQTDAGRERQDEAAPYPRAAATFTGERAAESRPVAKPAQHAGSARTVVDRLVISLRKAYGMVGAAANEAGDFDRVSADFVHCVANILAAFVERKTTEERLAYMAQFDALTGLPNRVLYLDRLAHTLIEASRDHRPVAVLFVDIDRFKVVNDTLGHAVGDQLLIHVAQRLLGAVRPADTVGRLSGDEFAVALAHLAHAEDAAGVARKIVAALAEPFHLEAQSVYVSASVGISIHPDDGMTADDLLRNADVAMYRAKEVGRNGFQFFVPNMHERAMHRSRVEARLRAALNRNEFVLHFQPRFELGSGTLCGLEALLRWYSPEQGLLLPGTFLPVLEDSGLILNVGEWVMAEVCTQVRLWQSAGIRVPPVAINISAKQFRQRDLHAVLDKVLSHTGVATSRLEFELTEAALMAEAELAPERLRRLRGRGLKVALDDFGTGYASLTHLRRLPLDAVKIDRSLVRNVPGDAQDATVVAAIIDLAHSLKLRTVAEGVETCAQLDFLRRHGCDEAQGYLLARPMPCEDAGRLLRGDAVPAVLQRSADPAAVNLRA